MILITTPTGHIGSELLKMLMASKEKLRVLVRDPAKLSPEVRARVEVIQGALDKPADLTRAYSGIEDLFYVIPPSTQHDDVYAYYKNFGELTINALKEQGVKRVVYVSGTGVNLDGNAGGVTASVYVEKMFEVSGVDVRILHCGTFMENLLYASRQIQASSEFGVSVPRDVKLPWVATKDIAQMAAKLLLDKNWKGVGYESVLGPKDMSYGEIAEVMSEVAGRKITYSEISSEALKANAMKFGASDAAAQALVDIYDSMRRGVFSLVKRTPQNSTPTELKDWLREHMTFN